MTKKEIIDYVMYSLENTNPSILGQMIDDVAGGEGGEGKGEIYATGINESGTEFYMTVVVDEAGIECTENTTTTKNYTEWRNFQSQLDGKYTAKLKGYFAELPTIELNISYLGNGMGWKLEWNNEIDNFVYSAGGEVEPGESFEVESFYIQCDDSDNNVTIYPTKLELIVYKK